MRAPVASSAAVQDPGDSRLFSCSPRGSLRGRSLLLAALLVAGGAVVPAVARSESASQRSEAVAKLQEGARALQEGAYVDALAAFKEAYRLVPSPKIHFNFGLAYLGLGRYADALDAFESFDREARDAKPESIAEARKQIAELRGRVATLSIACDTAAAEVFVDGRARGTTPLGGPFYVDPGAHQLVVRSAGAAPHVRAFSAAAGQAVKLDVRLAAVAITEPARPHAVAERAPGVALSATPRPRAAEEPAPLYRRPAFWIAVGVVAVAGGLGAAYFATRSDAAAQATWGQFSAF